MRKMNSTMVTISWIVTGIFALLFFISWGNAAKIQTPYGSPASSPPYILGMLIGNGLIPGILWLITYFTAPKVNAPNNQSQSKGGGYNGGYNGGHNDVSNSNNYSGGYNGGHNNSDGNNKSDGYNSGDLYK